MVFYNQRSQSTYSVIHEGHKYSSKLVLACFISDSMLEANKLFEGVLKRRERADATRNALGVLQRFRFLFTLPVTIERNIQRGEYDAVINDYARAQNLFGKTDVVVGRVFKLVKNIFCLPGLD